MSDQEIRDLQRRLTTLNARHGKLAIHRPSQDFQLPEDPYDGEEITILPQFNAASRRWPRIWSQNATIHLHGTGGTIITKPNQLNKHTIIPFESAHSEHLIRLIASVTDLGAVWFTLALHGSWLVEYDQGRAPIAI